MSIITIKEKENLIRYAKSTAVSFISGFTLGVLPLLQDVSIENFSKAFFLGVLFAGLRGGFKVLAENSIFKK